MRWRQIILLLVVASEGRFATASDAMPLAEQAQLELDLEQDVRLVRVPSTRVVLIPDAVATPDAINFNEVKWTASTSMPVEELAQQWGVRLSSLLELNPELEGAAGVQAGTSLVVFRQDAAEPTASIGSPNKGRLQNGMPIPEGPYWELREQRQRAFGTEGTVRALVQAFTAYGEAHPDGQRVHLGELSYRRGGRAFPHVSHRTGRDVDIGFIMKPEALGDRHWMQATADTLDVEKTWTLIKALGDTGRVQRIFISSTLQQTLKNYAATVVSEEELAKYFRITGMDGNQRYLITHENGHRDHLHVRFRCDSDDRRCRGWGMFPFADDDDEDDAGAARPSTAAP